MTAKHILRDEDIEVRPVIGRRSALAAALALAASRSIAEAATDSDPRDPPGRGRTGFTDRDAGAQADGAGRGVCAERGWSDSDPTDSRGRGRGPCH